MVSVITQEESAHSEPELLNNLWGLGTEQEWGYRTGPPDYIACGTDSSESIPGLHKRLKIGLWVILWSKESILEARSGTERNYLEKISFTEHPNKMIFPYL